MSIRYTEKIILEMDDYCVSYSHLFMIHALMQVTKITDFSRNSETLGTLCICLWHVKTLNQTIMCYPLQTGQVFLTHYSLKCDVYIAFRRNILTDVMKYTFMKCQDVYVYSFTPWWYVYHNMLFKKINIKLDITT